MEVTTVFSLLGGLGLFLFGIKTMGDGLEQAAGSKMKRLLEALTRNKLTAVLVGLLVTAVIQSSSATTVMDLFLHFFNSFHAPVPWLLQ